jgi:N-acetylglucosamine-6-phosphate deacetylase
VIALVGRVLAPEDRGVRSVVIDDGRVVDIADAADAPSDAPGGPDFWILPGLVDIQLNGAFGVDFSDPDADLLHAARSLPATGVTAFLPTIVSSAPDVYAPCLAAHRAAVPAGAARILGTHVEGPYLASERRGTHRVNALRAPDVDELRRWLKAGSVRILTLAPELPGAMELISEASSRDVVVAIGHSDATWVAADEAIAAGARLGTHLFNATRPFHHRDPGIVGRLLAPGVAVSVIVDGVHVAPDGVRMVAGVKRPDELIFVTDGLAALGEPPGRYRLGGSEVISDGTAARLADGTLSGSVIPMATALGRLVAAGLDASVAVHAASTVPARLLGLEDELGRIEVGRVADLVLVDPAWSPIATIVGGRVGHAPVRHQQAVGTQ